MSWIDRGNLAKLTLVVSTTLAALCVSVTPAFSQSICNAGNQTVTTWIDITASCTVTGSLTIDSGVVKANFSNAPTAVLRVEGNVTVRGTGALWIEGGTLEIQQSYNRHRYMSTADDATLVLKDTNVVVNQGAGVKYAVHEATDRSKTFVVNAVLDRTKNWLIGDYRGQSTLVAIGTLHVPTEIYVKESPTVRIAQPESHTGVWLDFADGAVGTIDLPIQADAGGKLQPYWWRVGRSSTGLTGVGWQLDIANATVGLGLESHSGSQITVNGRGAPVSGEIKIAYYAGAGTETISGLGIGLQSRTVGANQLTLRNVDLGPIAWQLYAYENDMLTINSSIVNEVGVANGGHITVNDSIIQFGGVSSLGGLSATLAVHNSQVHAQTIEAVRDGAVDIYDSAIYGAAVVSQDATAAVRFHGGALLQNDPDPCPLVLGEMMNAEGIPNCNPFLAPGAAVTRAGAGVVTCNGTYDCIW